MQQTGLDVELSQLIGDLELGIVRPSISEVLGHVEDGVRAEVEGRAHVELRHLILLEAQPPEEAWRDCC